MLITPEEISRIQFAAEATVARARHVPTRGYSNNRHWLAELSDGRTVFAKQAVDDASATWLRAEFARYQALRGPWLPEVVGWHDDGERPVLLLEDLSGYPYPPPWTTGRIDAVLHTLADVARHPVPADVVPASQTNYGRNGWPEVAAAPEPFLSLGLCSPTWLERALPVLLEAATHDLLDGDSLVHLDVRSDNMFLRDGGVVLVDWNLAAAGNHEFDVAFWLPSLRMEGGPEPESVCSPEPGVVALVAGFFAGRAGLPVIPTVPRVREVQRRQLEIALPWAVRRLDLPPLDGTPGRDAGVPDGRGKMGA